MSVKETGGRRQEAGGRTLDIGRGSLFIVWIALTTILGATARGEGPMSLDELLPRQIAGWRAAPEDRIYTRETLYDYIDGAAEIYLAYDFDRLLFREYRRESAPRIAAEIYRMSSPADAYGMFSHDTDGEEANVGQGAIYAAGLLRFWKDRIFVRLLAERETDRTKAVVMALGREIANAIPREGQKPLLVDCLPSEGLLGESVRYFHKQVSLNAHYYLAESNLLNLSEETEGVLARYRRNGRKVRLLLVGYRRPKDAKGAYEQFGRVYFPDRPPAQTPVRVEGAENREFVGARWTDRFVVLVFEAGDRRTCEHLIYDVEKKIKETFRWKENTGQEKDPPDATF